MTPRTGGGSRRLLVSGSDDNPTVVAGSIFNEITDITETAGSAWATPAHDRAGNMTTLPQSADPTQSSTGVWDGWNRLVRLVDDATSNTVQENQYDGRKFRVVRKDNSGGVLDGTRHYYYTSDWQAIEERQDTSLD